MSVEKRNREHKKSWKSWFKYQWMVKNIPFFLFLSALTVIYIYNGHFSDKTIKNINKVTKEVQELQYEYKTVRSEVMFRSKQSELVKVVAPLGLEALTESPFVLRDSLQTKIKQE